MKNLTNILFIILIFAVMVAAQVQFNAPWNLARLSHRDYQYPLATEYDYSGTGRGVTVYVIDSGIYIDHPEFEGRAVKGYGNLRDIQNCNGHGTHVAGTVGSATYGVAKQVSLVSVRVFPCTGPADVSDVIKGVKWVARDHKRGPAVALFADGAFYNPTLDDAFEQLVADGITIVTAGGNWNDNACNYSPAHLADVITVGSTDQRDFRDSISNYGPCVSLFAPGVAVPSLWSGQGGFYYNVMSGTSTAAPAVAGEAAIYLQSHPNASPAEVKQAIVGNATIGILTGADPDLFLYGF